jgi:hypothetical protein
VLRCPHITTITRRITMTKLAKLAKVNESITVNRYDNGWMVEVGGRDGEGDWKTSKILCSTEDEMVSVVKEWNNKELDI